MGDDVHELTLKNQCPYCGEAMEVDSHSRGEMVRAPIQNAVKSSRSRCPGDTLPRMARATTFPETSPTNRDRVQVFPTKPNCFAYIRRSFAAGPSKPSVWPS